MTTETTTAPTQTSIELLAAVLATAEGAKALITQPAKQTLMERAHNGNGGKHWNRAGDAKRASRASLSYHGVMLEVDYFPSGFCEEAYVEKVLTVEANGADIKVLLSEEQVDEIARRIEQSWTEVGTDE